MCAHEGFETLGIRELDIEHSAVSFDEREVIELAFVALVVERPEVAPINLEPFAGRGFHAHTGARG